jgi:hypothetical protein
MAGQAVAPRTAPAAERPLRDLFERADAMGLKGLTAFRPSPVRGDVLSAAAEEPP